jgi:hypothetical protein
MTKRHVPSHAIWLAAIAALILGACGALTAPQGFEQRLAYAYGVNTAVLNSTAASVKAGRLSPDAGESVLELSDKARLLLDLSRTFYSAGDIKQAEGQLTLAIGVLHELQSFVERQR